MNSPGPLVKRSFFEPFHPSNWLNKRIAGTAPRQMVCVALPYHTGSLEKEELAALKHCANLLQNHHRMLVVPEGVAVDAQVAELVTSVRRLPARFFASFAAHQKMCLSEQFYQLFADYEYVLIHHLDAVVFRDELLEWCQRGFCYIGAPFMWEDSARYAARRATLLRKVLARIGIETDIRVGNGGD